MRKVLLLEAQLRSYSRVKDGSVNIAFRSNKELTSEELKFIDEYFQQNGWMAFQPNEFKGGEIPQENAEGKPGQISPSQHLRNRLFAKHMATGGSKETFPSYYQRAMEGFAQAVDDSYEV